MSKDSNAKIFSVIGGCRRSGRWLVPARNDLLALFGRAVIDLRQAQTDAEELEFSCLSVFANITFLVPEGAEVRPSGMAVLGSSKCVVPVSDHRCHLPPISVDATTVFGRLRIRTTDVDPDEGSRPRRFRRRRAATTPVALDAPSDAEPSPDPDRAGERRVAPGGVDLQPSRRRREALDEPAPDPSPPKPSGRVRKADISGAIAPFRPDDRPGDRSDDGPDQRSPIHGVDVPGSLAGIDADPATAPGPSGDAPAAQPGDARSTESQATQSQATDTQAEEPAGRT